MVEELLAPPEWEPNGRDTVLDWTVRMAEDPVADVEVIRCTDEDAMWFMQSLSPDGSARAWSDARLSCERTISVSDHSPTTNKGLRLERLMDAVRDVLVMVKSQRQSPEQMRETDRWELRIDEDIHRYLGRSRYIFVLKEPHLVRPMSGGGGRESNPPDGDHPSHPL